jgi:FdhD protein
MVEPHDIYEDRELIQYTDGGKHTARQPIIKEAPLTIMLNGEELATLLCSPHSFELLAIGFLVGEGVLRSRHDLRSIAYQPEQGIVWVKTVDDAAPLHGFLRRNFASCCGKGRPTLHFLNDYQQLRPITGMTFFTVREVLGWTVLLDEQATTFKLTGGVHEVALANQGGFVVSYEDIGRHNALDRILGYTFLNGIATSDKAVVLSGRVASEMVAKAARIGVSVVVSRSAPTCLSIDVAEQLGITLVGFARGNSLSVYTHPDRIVQ